METKKTITADLEAQKSLFLMIGFVLVFGFIFIAFEWGKQAKVYQSITSIADFIPEDEIPITAQEVKPPPPIPEPVVVPPEIILVANNIVTSSGIEFTSETNTNEEITKIIAKPLIEDPDVATPLIVSEVKPSFPGGEKAMYDFLGKHIIYPSEQKDMRIQGRVVYQFTVNRDGSIVNITLLSKNGEAAFEQEALRVIKLMPNWIPGEQNKKKVRVNFILPVRFELNN